MTLRIRNRYQSSNDNYYRGSQPTAGQFDELKKRGIKTIIDLRKDSIDGASQRARDAGLQYVNIPLTTKQPATDDQTERFLKLINDPGNWPVFVHCKGGRHRTGEMTAIYRITHDGWSGDKAYEEMKKYDFEDSFFYPRSLKKYVFLLRAVPIAEDFKNRGGQSDAVNCTLRPLSFSEDPRSRDVLTVGSIRWWLPNLTSTRL
jgi:protein tyrosine phosphatase (PTP) superfamily phosphohydrolase (DUF442 family)